MVQHITRALLVRAFLLSATVLFLTLLLDTSPVHAATLPTGFSETVVAGGLSRPTAFAFAADGRIFVTEEGGALRVIKNNALLPDPFVTLSVDDLGERGLLGIALDPEFSTNPNKRFVYVYYTVNSSPPHNRISRFTANGDVAAGSETILVELEDLGASNHNGGAIHFGPDGKLYAGVGENAVASNAETLDNRLGKILRYNADGSIPTGNPFYSVASGKNRSIWALGLRNPFTFAFQPGTGRMFINDVGAGSREEINDGIAGSNYGWNTCEGPCNPPNPSFRDPLYAYPHSAGAGDPHFGCAIIGGAFYNPATAQFPAEYSGDYFFADLCRGWIDRYDPIANSVHEFATGAGAAVDLYVSPDGALYYLSRSSNEVKRITYSALVNTPTRTPTRTNTPVNTPTRTATRTHTPTRTPTLVPSATFTPSPPAPATNTRPPTRTRTNTRVPTTTFTPDGVWIYCTKEGKMCRFTGTRQVRFGANNKYKIKTFTDMVRCNVANFGDPIPGVKKHCHYHQ